MPYLNATIYFPGEQFSWSNGVWYCPSPCTVRLSTDSDTRRQLQVDWGDGNEQEISSWGVDTYHSYNIGDPRTPEKYTIIVRTIDQDTQIMVTLSMSLQVYGRWATNQNNLNFSLSPTTVNGLRVGSAQDFTASIPSGVLCHLTEDREKYTWEWKISHNGSSWYSIANAISAGWVDLYNDTYAIDKSTIRIKFKEAGTYVVYSRAYGYRVSSLSTATPSWYEISGSAQTNTLTVLAQPTPSIQLVSYHDVHNNQNLNGKAPFTATFKDISMTTQPNQPAIVSRVWSFGDPQSGALNTSTNQQQAHQFVGGYGPFTVTLTITNTLGESASTTYQFAPNLPRRVTQDINPTPLSGTAPLLVTCNVETAGEPEPVTTWSYQLANDPGYYSGSKEGDYAELSLLAPGTYTITRKVSQDGQSDLTRTWTVTVSAPTPTARNQQPMRDFLVWQYNDAGTQRTAQLDVISDPRIQWNFMTGKVFTFRVAAKYDAITGLRAGTKLAVGFGGYARPFIIVSRTDDPSSEYVEFECIDYAEAIMEARIALVATQSTSGNGYDVQTCSGEALMRYFAIANLNSGRTDSLFKVLGTNTDIDGTTVTYSARYETIDEIMADLCTASGLGWDVIINDGTTYIVGWQPILGTDRTVDTTAAGVTPVILAARLQTATIGQFAEQMSKTIAVGAGDGSGAARVYTPYNIAGTPSPSVTGIDRREVFVDAGDAADSAEVKRMAVKALKDGQAQTIYVYPDRNGQFKFGTDYQVGDFVTVEDPHIGRLNLRILSADFSAGTDGQKLELKCGTDQANYNKILQAQARSNTYARK